MEQAEYFIRVSALGDPDIFWNQSESKCTTYRIKAERYNLHQAIKIRNKIKYLLSTPPMVVYAYVPYNEQRADILCLL
jgi:hypothetical protein